MKIIIEKQFIPSSLSSCLVVAMDGGEIAGSAAVNSWKSECPALQSLFVKPRYRRKGVASRIIAEVVALAAKHEKAAITLTVNKNNKAAIALYKKSGFFKFTDDEKVWWMSKPLEI